MDDANRSARLAATVRERDAALAVLPDFAWPTLALGVVLPSIYATLIAVGVAGLAPLWLCTLVQAPLAYAHYMLVHESLHHNLARRGARWVQAAEAIFGRLGAAVLLSNWPFARRTHLAHHKHVNTAHDPDIFVKGLFVRLFAVWLRAVPMAFVPPELLRWIGPHMFGRLRPMFSRTEWFEANAAHAVYFAVFAAFVAAGYGIEALMLWILPGRLGGFLLMVFFQWLPHHPHEDGSRYGSGRLSFWPGSRLLLMWQDIHLMHHLWPRVPFYRLGALYALTHDDLIARGVRREGLRPGRAIARMTRP